MNVETLFAHDCTCCTKLGLFKGQDLYHCMQGGNRPTIIHRFGDDGPDYTSGIVFADVDEHIKEGVDRAKVMGLPLN